MRGYDLTKNDLTAPRVSEADPYHYVNPFNGLTPAENERLAWLSEEAAEIGRIIGKIQRFGYASRHPDGGPTNREELISEINDLLAVITFMNGPDLQMAFEDVQAPASHKARKLKYAVAQ